MCAIANNINLVGQERYKYARVSFTVGGKDYRWILHAELSRDDFAFLAAFPAIRTAAAAITNIRIQVGHVSADRLAGAIDF